MNWEPRSTGGKYPLECQRLQNTFPKRMMFELSLQGVKSVFLDSLPSVRYCARFCGYAGEQDRCSLLYGTVRLLGRVLSKNILSDYEAKKVNEEHSRQTKYQ